MSLLSCSDDDDSGQVDSGGEETPPEVVGGAAINEFSVTGDWVELANFSNAPIDVSGYFLCLGPGTYRAIGDLEILAGESATIAPGQFLVVGYSLPDNSGGLGLYESNTGVFVDPEVLADFVQYGEAGSIRESVAVSAGIWTDGDFVTLPSSSSSSLAYDGTGNSSSDWEAATPTVGTANVPLGTTTFNVTITNSINYLGAVSYNSPQNTSPSRSNPTRASLDSPGEFYEIDFIASPGANMSFVSMSSISNDWLFAPRGEGIQIFNAADEPILGDITSEILLWDAGTEEENPATFGGAGMGDRADDDDDTVRVQDADVSEYIRAELTNYDSASRTFTLRITNLRGEFAIVDPIRVSPGIVVLHAQDNPFFTEGQSDRGNGLQLIAERGNISELWEWLNEEGTDGAPLRIASSWSTISPGIVYAFNTDTDPWFTQGDAMVANSGVEELAEAGNNQVAFDYLNGMGIPVVRSNETTNLIPGESLTFAIEVPNNQNYKLGFATMLTRTNDWFMSFNNNGVALFDANLVPFSGTSESDEIYLFDAGTEADELVGIGDFLGSIEGPVDANTTIRRVQAINDQQFGKGIINSAPGTAWIGDPRGGYNLLEIDVQPQ